jgi:predicted O-methyltransferase YrrM
MDDAAHEALSRYVRDLFVSYDPVLDKRQAESRESGLPAISIKPEEGQMLQFLLKMINAVKVVEIGTLAGYSGTWLARALPDNGKLITLDNTPAHHEFASQTFKEAGVSGKVDARLGKALDLLKKAAEEGPFDAVFIDADKDSYPAYLDWSLANVRRGGLIMAHNAFFGGTVIGLAEREAHLVNGLKTFNERLAHEPRLFGTIIPIGDGIAAAIVL